MRGSLFVATPTTRGFTQPVLFINRSLCRCLKPFFARGTVPKTGSLFANLFKMYFYLKSTL